MFCPECGTKNEDYARFCAKCGTLLNVPEDHAEPMEAVDYNGMNPEQPQVQQPVYEQQPQMQQPVYEQPQMQQPMYQQPMYGQPMYQQPPKPRQPRKPLSKLAKIVIAESVLAVALIGGTVTLAKSKTDPKNVAESYWKAMMNQDWSLAYEYCDFPESEMLTKQMFVDAKAGDTKKIQYNSYTIKEKVQETNFNNRKDEKEKEAELQKIFEVEYVPKGSSDRRKEYITLTKLKEKKYLFLPQWRVTTSDALAEDITFNIPENASLFFNGVEMKAKKGFGSGDNEEGMKRIEVPYLFRGTYQMEVKSEGMEPYRAYYNAPEDGYMEIYRMMPAADLRTQLAEQAGADMQKILESAYAGKSFEDIRGLFTEEALRNNSAENSYQSLVKMQGNRETEGVIKLTIKNVTAQFLDARGSNDSTIYMSCKCSYGKKYLDTWWNTTEVNERENDCGFDITYVKEGGVWKLNYMPIDSGYFY